MRAVKGGLPAPYGEGEEPESPRWRRGLEDRLGYPLKRERASLEGQWHIHCWTRAVGNQQFRMSPFLFESVRLFGLAQTEADTKAVFLQVR